VVGNTAIPVNEASPASAEGENIYTVSALTPKGALNYFSNFGQGVDASSPGGKILSTYLNNGYETLSGTSMSCAHFAGLLLLESAGLGELYVDGYSEDRLGYDNEPDPIYAIRALPPKGQKKGHDKQDNHENGRGRKKGHGSSRQL